MRQRIVFVVAVAFVCSPWAFAQGSEQSASQTTPNNPNGTNAQAGSTANAVIEQNGSTIPRSFIGATPGVFGTPGVFPGFPSPSFAWETYYSAIHHVWKVEEMDRVKRKFHLGDILPMNWKTRTFSAITDPNMVPPNNNPIQIVPWWAYSFAYPDDREIGRIDVVCDPFQETTCLGLALAEAKRQTHTSRVSMRARIHHRTDAKGFSIGSGGSGAASLSHDDVGAAAAVGGLIGKNTTEYVDWIEFDLICMNDGPIVPPALPAPPEQPRRAREFQPPPSPASSSQTVHVAVDPIVVQVEYKQPLVVSVSHLPSPLPPPSIPTPPPAQEACAAEGFPNTAVFFDFDKSLFKPEYLPKVLELVAWMGTHSKCQVEIVGQTCKSGGYHYDAGLGLLRAKAVYEVLIAHGANREQLVRYTSTGKDFSVSEYDEKNRRASANIFKPNSAK